MILWDTCRQDFEPDGALRDIYVRGMTFENWRSFYGVLRSTYNLEYSVEGTQQPLPTSVEEALAAISSFPMLRFRIGNVMVVCHFFTTDEIEMDIEPSEVTSQESLNDLLGLLRLVGDTLQKSVILSYESDEQHPFIIYESSRREFQYLRPGVR